ncbi:Hypothetical protein R9X50_00028500 [Acrodontium crateriforme]|uniref:FHA domain-containing protein n=1 Tax=Acrodontium crateriforme TaxID=150365 RepID=A0AAQ3R4T4_9PEZI|nr:Hypothetical protein R9X50_00028500 [Acrodontium crateriforme]
MWLLSCEGDLFAGKARWLRPGSAHLFGRTSGRSKDGARIQYIDHKTVSRRHVVIEVGDVAPADSSLLHKRTEVKVTDASKAGTTLNGEKLSKETKILDGKDYTIKLGSYEQVFRLVWRPVNLCCTNLSGRSKAKAEELNSFREKLAGSDIKMTQEYVAQDTTHLVARKRNTPTALQALVNQKWLVTYEYIDALATAIKRSGLNENGDPRPCALELEFENGWPDEKHYIVPAGGEPVPRDNEYLIPRPERAEVFDRYTFIFLTKSQFDNLTPVVTSGGGKTLLWEVEDGVSNVEDLVDYVKSVAGKKGVADFRLSQHETKGGTVVVRLNDAGEWSSDFNRDTCLALDQTAIAQNEFLDAILVVNAANLRRQLPEHESLEPDEGALKPGNSPPRSLQQNEQPAPSVLEASTTAKAQPSQPQADENSAEQPTRMSRKRTRRAPTQPRFKGFDDFDPSQFAKPRSLSPEPSVEPSQPVSVLNMEIDDTSRNESVEQASKNGLKRAAPVAAEDNYDEILQGQAALKRRRLEAKAKDNRASSIQPPDSEPGQLATVTKKKKVVKEVDVRAEVRARRDFEEEERRKDEAALEDLKNIDISELKNVAVIEEMELPVRERPPRTAGEHGRREGWDPAWNGRKNFKKFRPQGQRRDGPRLQRVIVRLEEIPRKGNGIGDEYWLQPSISTQSSKGKGKSQSQSQSVRSAPIVPNSVDEDDSIAFRRRLQQTREDDALEAEILPEEIAGTARDSQFQPSPSQTIRAETQKPPAKRTAASQGGPAPKKSRPATVPSSRGTIDINDDDDDDGLKFRRRKR